MPPVIQAPKPHTVFRLHNGRLALFRTAVEHVDYWRDYWSTGKRAALTRTGTHGDVGEFAPVIERYVPRDLPVLEAGCGPAHLVLALQHRGYAVSGVDYEPEVVAYVNREFPHVEVRHGDVLALEMPSGSLGCYLSIGVVEHFESGPGPALQEARRLLHEEGVALISVPYLNRFRAAHRPDTSATTDLHFHQYYFSRGEFEAQLRSAGLHVVDHYPYAVEAFVTREHPRLSRGWRSPLMRARMKRPLRAVFRHAPTRLRDRYAHMMMFVCKPK